MVKGKSAIRRNHTTSWVAIFDFRRCSDMSMAFHLPIFPGLPIFLPNLYTGFQEMPAIPILLYRSDRGPDERVSLSSTLCRIVRPFVFFLSVRVSTYAGSHHQDTLRLLEPESSDLLEPGEPHEHQ